MKFSKKIVYFLLCFLCYFLFALLILFLLDFLIQWIGRAQAYLVLVLSLLFIIPLVTFFVAEHFSKKI